MRHRFGLTLKAVAVAVAAAMLPLTCAAQARLSPEHGGQGLRPQTAPGVDAPSGGEAKQSWPSRQPSEFTLFGGSRELTRGGLGAAEAYGGVAYGFSRSWASSFEAAYAPESLLAPRQYALAWWTAERVLEAIRRRHARGRPLINWKHGRALKAAARITTAG